MRYYSTYCAAMSVVRKEDYYMSTQTARRIVKKLAYVLELTPILSERVVVQLTRGQDCEFSAPIDSRCEGFTPAQLEVVRNLSCWFSYEYTGSGENPAFVVCNLNEGRSLVISESRKTRGDRSTSSYLENGADTGRPAKVVYANIPEREDPIDPSRVEWSLVPYLLDNI